MPRKRIRCICSNAIAVSSEVEEPWADVWVQWKERPGRKRRMYGPTLMARADVAAEVERYEQLIPYYTEHNEGCETLGIKPGEMLEFVKEELPKARELLARLDADNYLCDFGDDGDHGTPNLYTSAEWLTRGTAEALLARWLREEHGIHNPKFEWDRPGVFVRSM